MQCPHGFEQDEATEADAPKKYCAQCLFEVAVAGLIPMDFGFDAAERRRKLRNKDKAARRKEKEK